ncbi:gamma-interferon-inducible lysosomal thiol reductase [Callorhinchus milii]|uniref:gamma-interferon-inducible lysosomal thiol reductase n=1 Tax=Callorhinchus milii TaxID=7868 RepID=UPI001C3F748E|nr:gamma-interferon-inducible lysosomal thiol reductase [Callorhinchus milii]
MRSSAVWLLCLLFWAVSEGEAKPACNYSPAQWCSSYKIAAACQVLGQCPGLERDSAPPVEISLYYESLCPACRSFLVLQLYPTWLMLHSIMNVTLVPYGNAQEKLQSGKWAFECQHGEQECLGNMIEACLMHTLKNPENYFPIIYCMESAPYVIKAAELCVRIYEPAQTWSTVESCVQGDLGNQLMHRNAVQTEALNPPHQYVPWILVNGNHTDVLESHAVGSLFNLVCNLYTGTKPEACAKAERKELSVCLA